MSVKRKYKSKKKKADSSEVVPLPVNSISPLASTPDDDDQLIEINVSNWVKPQVELTVNPSSSTEHLEDRSDSLEQGMPHVFSLEHEVYDRISPAYSSSEQLSTPEQVSEPVSTVRDNHPTSSSSQASRLCSPTSSSEQLCSLFAPHSPSTYASAPVIPELHSHSALTSDLVSLRRRRVTPPSRPVSAYSPSDSRTIQNQLSNRSTGSFLSDNLNRTLSDGQGVGTVPTSNPPRCYSFLPLIRGSSINTSNESDLSDITSSHASRPRSLADYFTSSNRSSLGKSLDSETQEDPNEDDACLPYSPDPLVCDYAPSEYSSQYMGNQPPIGGQLPLGGHPPIGGQLPLGTQLSLRLSSQGRNSSQVGVPSTAESPVKFSEDNSVPQSFGGSPHIPPETVQSPRGDTSEWTKRGDTSDVAKRGDISDGTKHEKGRTLVADIQKTARVGKRKKSVGECLLQVNLYSSKAATSRETNV